ncbi:TetR/AcrR family transcriptional regulator [Caulobacter sp. KR2-114]|uniref:TetR/AcrR family transcriptional regulator n=1 Tax=Caulobacter sp. KR2-114 TaxID=3400912 RepID=UPI003C04E0D4
MAAKDEALGRTPVAGEAPALGQGAGKWGRTAASQARRREILAAAKHVFFRQGYHLASLDQVAQAAGVTRRTVYDHFGSKEALFAEVIAFASGQFIDTLPSAGSLQRPPAAGLAAFVQRLRAAVAEPGSARFQRIVIAEAERHPEFGAALYRATVLATEKVLADYLNACIADGLMTAVDVAAEARLVVSLTTNTVRLRALLGQEPAPPEPAEQAALDAAIARITGAAGR